MKPRHILYFLPFLAMATAVSGAGASDGPASGGSGFVLPLACTPGTDCWVMNYVDTGPDGDGTAIDPFCGKRSYEKNKGTVFALRDIPQMERGMNVVAARDGVVKKVRSGEPDRIATEKDLQETQAAQKECGNAVLIDHGGGVQSVYCHLKMNSITVKPGDNIKAGNAIGQVGLSGYTTFPQLHFGITSRGSVIDPFTGQRATDTCGTVKRRLWDSSVTVEYEPAAFYNAGFSGVIPSLRNIDAGHGRQTSLPTTTPVISFWAGIFGADKGDVITMDITGPDGTIIASRSITQDAAQTRQFYYTGRKISEGKLPAGEYVGKATLTRTQGDGTKKIMSIERTLSVQGE